MSVAYFWLFLLLLACGMPVLFALLVGPGLSLFIDGSPQYLSALLSRLYNGVDSFPLLAVPFFILAGEVMNSGGITRGIVYFSQTMIGHFRGGLAQVMIPSSMLFSSISGSAVANASALGRMLVPSMEQNGYGRGFAAAVTAAAAVIGPIIPPSGIMVLYGFVMNISIGALFAGGVVPGVMIGIGLMIAVRLLADRYNLPPATARASWGERARAFKGTAPALLTPVILLGGILGGFFTATEAAAVAAAYAMIVSVFVMRTQKISDVPQILINTAVQSSVILLLVGAAVSFAWLVTVSGMAEAIANTMTGLSDNVYVLLFLLNVMLFIVGMILDAGPAILILGPVLGPVFTSLGVDPVHFALIMCINLTVGLITPPMGLVLFVASAVSGERLEKVLKPLLPFLLVEIIVIFLVTYFPVLTLGLPRALGLMQ